MHEWPPTLFQESHFHIRGFTPISSFMTDMLYFLSRWGCGKGFKDIWSLCGASLFKWRNQRPPMCYTSNVVKRGGGGSADLAQTRLKSWSAPTKSMLADAGERSTTLWSSPALATHCASTDNVYHSVLLLTATFFFLPFPSLLSLWQAGLSLIVSFMTDTEWGLALIQGRPCIAFLWFLSTSLADVWWWHIWQKPSKMEGWVGAVSMYV